MTKREAIAAVKVARVCMAYVVFSKDCDTRLKVAKVDVLTYLETLPEDEDVNLQWGEYGWPTGTILIN